MTITVALAILTLNNLIYQHSSFIDARAAVVAAENNPEVIMFKKMLMFSVLLLFSAKAAWAEELPTLKVGYIFTSNHAPLIVAMSEGEKLTVGGYSLSPVIPKEKYTLLKNGRPTAVLDIIVAKSGSEVSTLFAQKHLDISLASITAIIAGIDKEVPMKIVAPVVLVSGGLVVGKDSGINTWAEFIESIKAAREPVKIGYHSPTSAPLIITEAALRSEGLTISRNPNDTEAQVIMVDLKETSNMLPALISKQVEAVTGPAPFPQTAVTKDSGRFITELRDMPPAGRWTDYPCCVVAASDDLIAANPALLKDFAAFITAANAWSNENNVEAGIIAAKWLGLSEEVGRTLRQTFIASFSDKWKEAAGGYLEVLNEAGYFTGALKGKTFQEAESLLMDERFIGDK